MSARIIKPFLRSTSLLSSRRSVLSQIRVRDNTVFNFQPTMNLMTITNSIKESYSKHELIPDVIAEKNFSPKGLLIISYGKDKDVVLGNTLKVDETQELPKVAFTLNVDTNDDFVVTPEDKFAFVLTDPDAPSRTDKKWSEYAHYIVKDLKLNPVQSSALNDNVDGLTTDLAFDDAITLLPYQGPGPPPKTGKHRYCFLFFKQKIGVDPEAPSDRPNWGTGVPASGVKEWAEKYQLQLLAANFFYAQNESQ